MREITIPIPDGKRAEWINGVLTLVNEQKVGNRPVTERIKTFDDACNALGDEHPLVKAYKGYVAHIHQHDMNDYDFVAYLKLRIIVAALNEGWEPKFEKGEYRYYPWFYLYTKEEYDELDDEQKGRCVLRSGNYSFSCRGFVSSGTNYNASYSYTINGSRLAFRTRELADYAGRQFIEEWADFMFKPRTGEELNGKQRSSESNQTCLNCRVQVASVEPKSEVAKTTIDFNNNEDE